MKKCVFCKKDSTNSVSVEHIVPESLGNKSHTLPRGIVCDECNNYFALKIEKPILEQDFFKNLRHRNKIVSKKGKIPEGKVIVPIFFSEGIVKFDKKYTIVDVEPMVFDAIIEGKIDYFIVPYNTKPPENDRSLSRLLGKIALEGFLSKINHVEGALDFFINNSDFDPLRNYVRYNKGKELWNYHVREAYSEDEKFYNDGNILNEPLDMLFEFDFLLTKHQEVYFTIIIKGYEFTINLGGECIDGYLDWLTENNYICPLYRKEKICKDVPLHNNILKDIG